MPGMSSGPRWRFPAMMKLLLRVSTLLVAWMVAGCDDSTSPRDTTPPAAPRGLHSITGDHEVFLKWLENTEPDVVGYRIYEAPCASGDDCPYERVATTTGTEFVVRDLANGVTRY